MDPENIEVSIPMYAPFEILPQDSKVEIVVKTMVNNFCVMMEKEDPRVHNVDFGAAFCDAVQDKMNELTEEEKFSVSLLFQTRMAQLFKDGVDEEEDGEKVRKFVMDLMAPQFR